MRSAALAALLFCTACSPLQPIIAKRIKLRKPYPCSMTPVAVWFSDTLSAGWKEAYEWTRKRYVQERKDGTTKVVAVRGRRIA